MEREEEKEEVCSETVGEALYIRREEGFMGRTREVLKYGGGGSFGREKVETHFTWGL